MDALAQYAKIAQENNMVPIVEPEILMDGEHSAQDCLNATSRSLKSYFSISFDAIVTLSTPPSGVTFVNTPLKISD